LLASLTLQCAAQNAPTSTEIKQLADDYFARKPSTAIRAGFNGEQALAAQKEFLALLSPKLGKVVGYKVGLTSKAVQESLGASSPVRGVLLEKMILKNGATVSTGYGARPIYEPDFIVTVKDEGINDAKTILDVAKHLRDAVAFIELPDRIIAETEKVDGNLITAMNVSARLGVLGDRLPIQATPEFLNAFEKMRVKAVDETGAELAHAEGTALLGHPLNPVLWLIEDFKKTGDKLKAGDLISLGSFAKPVPPKPGQTITVTYEGLPGKTLRVTAHFTH
jgi:2-keto-4-pentenoate hydratase